MCQSLSSLTSNFIRYSSKNLNFQWKILTFWNRRGSSALKSIAALPEFGSQHPHSHSQTSVTSVPGVRMPSPASCNTSHIGGTQMYMQTKHTYMWQWKFPPLFKWAWEERRPVLPAQKRLSWLHRTYENLTTHTHTHTVVAQWCLVLRLFPYDGHCFDFSLPNLLYQGMVKCSTFIH